MLFLALKFRLGERFYSMNLLKKGYLQEEDRISWGVYAQHTPSRNPSLFFACSF